jgi:hypothetical protein
VIERPIVRVDGCKEHSMSQENAPANLLFLRHTLATLAYRAGKALRDAPSSFGEFRVAPGTRTPAEILAHMNDLLDWARHLVGGEHVWHDSSPGPWPEDVERFFAKLESLDQLFAGREALGFPPERLFQGPIADALSHTGQIAMLRRLAGSPIRGENYFKAEIVAGRCGADQAEPRREFD